MNRVTALVAALVIFAFTVSSAAAYDGNVPGGPQESLWGAPLLAALAFGALIGFIGLIYGLKALVEFEHRWHDRHRRRPRRRY